MEEPLTTYRAKGKEIGLVFLFKYDLMGNLRLFEISEGVLNKEQRQWLLTGYLPEGAEFENAKQLLAQLEPRFPHDENIMKTIWMKVKKYLKVFEIEKSPADLSFDALWDMYGYKESRKDAENAFKKLKEADKIKCFIQVPKYKKKLAQSTISQALLATWINKQRFNDEY
jgi:hypothetical protein